MTSFDIAYNLKRVAKKLNRHITTVVLKNRRSCKLMITLIVQMLSKVKYEINVQMFVKGHQKSIFSLLPAYISFTLGSLFFMVKSKYHSD